MQLPPELHTRLASELRFATDKMRGTEDPFKKVYYLSAFFGEATRVLNWQWDRDLALLHEVVTRTQQAVSQRLQSMMPGGERVVMLTPAFMESLTKAAEDLADWLEHSGTSEQFLALMGRFAEIGYATSGNGFYLMEKGHLQLTN